MGQQSASKMKNWQELEQRLYMQTTKRLPVTLVRGQGSRVWDAEGKEYLDFVGGWAVIPDGFINVDYNNVDAIKAATTARTCAVMVEPVQGEGGVNVPHDKYLRGIRAWCDEKGVLLILDEIQTGIGRTGTLFAYEQFGIEPDVMTLAKGLGSGVPIGALLAKEGASVFAAGEHGSTFGGNPLVCAASFATLKFIIDNDVPGKARRVGQYLVSGLEKLKGKFGFIVEVRGRGLLLALGFTDDIAEEVVLSCLEEGLLVNGVKPDALRFMPPLTTTESEVDEALDILERVFSRRP